MAGTVDLRALADYLEGGLLMFVGSRAADLTPECMMAAAARVEAPGDRLTVYVPEALAGPTLANLRAHPQVAVNATRVTDDRSTQLKGVFVAHRPATEDERPDLERQLERRDLDLALVGMPRSASARLVWWPAVALEIEVREVYEQTPGPRAGHPLAPSEGR